MKFLVFFASIVLSAVSFGQVKKPNFIVIFMDDMGFGDIGVNGALDYRTPNLDNWLRKACGLQTSYLPRLFAALPALHYSLVVTLTGWVSAAPYSLGQEWVWLLMKPRLQTC
jgi:hypothetical protein